MTKIKFIYYKTVDYMSRMALEKDDFGRFTVIWEFLVTGNWVEARVASRVKIGLLTSRLVQYIYIHIYIYIFFLFSFRRVTIDALWCKYRISKGPFCQSLTSAIYIFTY